MPNYSYNNLTLEGNNKDLEKFYLENKSEDNELCFLKSVPRPKEEEDNWYKWNIENFGTKWNTCESKFYSSIEFFDKDIVNTKKVLNKLLSIDIKNFIPIVKKILSYKVYKYVFYTAWSPPIAWLIKVSGIYSNIKFSLEYSVEGFNNGGIIVFKDGKMLINDEWDVSEKYYTENQNEINNFIYNYLINNNINFLLLNQYDKKIIILKILNEIRDNYSLYMKENFLKNIILKIISKRNVK